jgi:hypothetical protein
MWTTSRKETHPMKQWFTVLTVSFFISSVTYGILQRGLDEKRILPSECPAPVVERIIERPPPVPAATFDLRVRRGVNMQSYEDSIDAGGANICIGPHVKLDGVTFHTFTEDDGGWWGTEISSNCPEEKGTHL